MRFESRDFVCYAAACTGARAFLEFADASAPTVIDWLTVRYATTVCGTSNRGPHAVPGRRDGLRVVADGATRTRGGGMPSGARLGATRIEALNGALREALVPGGRSRGPSRTGLNGARRRHSCGPLFIVFSRPYHAHPRERRRPS